MNENRFDAIRELFPQTPASFTIVIDRAVRNLPAKTKWKLPGSVIAFAAATCAVAGLVAVCFIGLPGGKTNLGAGASAEASWTPAGTPMQLQTNQNAALPTSKEGWQAVAVGGDTSWYWQQNKSLLACVKSGTCDTVSLGLKKGEVGQYTFVTPQDGSWVAFTVHGKDRDTVWVVTNKGLKLNVPGNVQGYNNGTYFDVQVDFSGASMVPLSARQITPAVGSTDPTTDYFSICASFKDGEAFSIAVGWQCSGDQQLFANEKETCIALSPRGNNELLLNEIPVLKLIQTSTGQYAVPYEGRVWSSSPKNNRFILFKATDYSVPTLYYRRALCIYEGDSTHTLWELNLETGETTEIASGCIAAGWLDDKTYWYASGSDSVAIKKCDASDIKALHQQVYFGSGSFSCNENPPTVTIDIYVRIQNMTGQTWQMPDSMQCDLSLLRDGQVIWTKSDPFNLNSTKVSLVGPDGNTDLSLYNEPEAVPSGDTMEIQLPEIDTDSYGEFTLEGSFNNVNIYATDYYGVHNELPVGVSLKGTVDPDGKVTATIENKSRATFAVPHEPLQYTDASKTNFWPPHLVYRLLSGSKVLCVGNLTITKDIDELLPLLQPGKSITFTSETAIQNIPKLPAGSYTLECYVDAGGWFATDPWGLAPGYYFDIPFTIPAK